jgi:hypothetical protein
MSMGALRTGVAATDLTLERRRVSLASSSRRQPRSTVAARATSSRQVEPVFKALGAAHLVGAAGASVLVLDDR